MAKIIKLYKEALLDCTLVGRCYHSADSSADKGFAHKWEEWLAGDAFDKLAKCGEPCSDACVGAMRMNDGEFEYWIGMLFKSVDSVPEGMQSVCVPGGEFAVAWIQGPDNFELYTTCDKCGERFTAEGWVIADKPWYFERYVCPRFTVPDENGEVILDFMAALK